MSEEELEERDSQSRRPKWKPSDGPPPVARYSIECPRLGFDAKAAEKLCHVETLVKRGLCPRPVKWADIADQLRDAFSKAFVWQGVADNNPVTADVARFREEVAKRADALLVLLGYPSGLGDLSEYQSTSQREWFAHLLSGTNRGLPSWLALSAGLRPWHRREPTAHNADLESFLEELRPIEGSDAESSVGMGEADDVRMAQSALKAIPLRLAMLSYVAVRSAVPPRPEKRGQKTEPFTPELFVRLNGLHHYVFGKAPHLRIGESSQYFGPTVDWLKAIFQHAAKHTDGLQEADAALLRKAAKWSNKTLGKKMQEAGRMVPRGEL